MSGNNAPPSKKAKKAMHKRIVPLEDDSSPIEYQLEFHKLFPTEIRNKIQDEIIKRVADGDPTVLTDGFRNTPSVAKMVHQIMRLMGRHYHPLGIGTDEKHLISKATSTEEPIQPKAEAETQTEPVGDVPSTTDDLLSSGSKPKRSAKVHSAPMEVDPESEGAPMLDSNIHVKLVIKGFPLEEDPEKAKVWLEPLGFKCTSASRLSSKRGKLAKPLRMVLVHIAGKKMDDLLQISELGGFPIKVEKFNRKRWSRNTQTQSSKRNSHASCPPRPAKLSDVRRPRTGQMTKQEILGQLFLLASSVANSRF